jgi:dTDP-4-dehydrorhamnose reductase
MNTQGLGRGGDTVCMLGQVRALIVGASGYLGNELRRQAAGAGHDVIGTQFSARHQGLRQLDIRDASAVAEAITQVRPDSVVNASYSKASWAATAVGPGHLAACCAREGIRLVHVSSDAVFSGDLASYDESCDPSPVSEYGAAKAAAEVVVAARDPRAAIVRTSWITGDDGQSGSERLIADLARGGSGVLFTDDVKTPVHVADLAAAVLELCASDLAGVVHVAGTDAVSRHELGCLIADRDGLDPAVLPAGTRSSAGMKPSVVRLDVTRAAGLLATRLRGAHEFTAVTPPG